MEDQREKNFEHYPGGKGRSYQHIINLMPPHARYIETHVGGGAILRRKRRATRNVIIDLDPTVTGRWKALGLDGVAVREGDALKIIPTLAVTADDLMYSDPPYLPESRRTRRYYRHDYDETDHVALLELLMTLPCKIVLSGYRNDLYDHRLADWTRTDYEALTHNGVVTESAWTNFVPGPVLHDYRYIGSNFREREASRRRCDGLIQRIAAANPVERNAVLAELATSHPDAVLQAARRIPA